MDHLQLSLRVGERDVRFLKRKVYFDQMTLVLVDKFKILVGFGLEKIGRSQKVNNNK